jgi:hypothetical protein
MIKKVLQVGTLLVVLSVIFSFLVFPEAIASTVNVPGTSDPWLAGMPNASLDNIGTPEPADVAPGQSPVFVNSISIGSGTILNWSASGQVGHPGDLAGPDGYFSYILNRSIGANNGISDITAPINALLGVFLGPGQPNLNPPPSTLDFSAAASRDYVSLAPALQQVFFMGDGLGGVIEQNIMAPPGATRLFLGTMDGYGWANNIGSFDVTIESVPEPTTILLLGLGLACLSGLRRKFST